MKKASPWMTLDQFREAMQKYENEEHKKNPDSNIEENYPHDYEAMLDSTATAEV